MAHDRMTSDAVPLTHEFLAVMLGVRRAGVTVAIHGFERRGLVTTRRGQLTLVNRAGIEEIAGSFYGTPETELKRLLSDGKQFAFFAVRMVCLAMLPAKFQTGSRPAAGSARAHQLALVAHAEKGESVLLVAPTGGGKTLAGFLPSLIDSGGQTQTRPQARPAHALYLAAQGAGGRRGAQSGHTHPRDGLVRDGGDPHRRHLRRAASAPAL